MHLWLHDRSVNIFIHMLCIYNLRTLYIRMYNVDRRVLRTERYRFFDLTFTAYKFTYPTSKENIKIKTWQSQPPIRTGVFIQLYRWRIGFMNVSYAMYNMYTEKNDLEISLRNLEYSDSFSKIRKYQFPNLEKT